MTLTPGVMACTRSLASPAPPPHVCPKPRVSPTETTAELANPPDGFVDLRQVLPMACYDIRYASHDNFTGAPLPGYEAPGAWMEASAAKALALAAADLAEQGLGLLIYDAYRPRRATLAMVQWAEAKGRRDLLDDGYIARRSGHNRGDTVDLTLLDRATGQPLDMGTSWDTFSTDSHTFKATGAVLERRLTLRRALMRRGFKPYEAEWWHFSFGKQPRPAARDLPYGRQ